MNDEHFDESYEEDAIEIEALGIEVSSHPIELYKLFKVANLVGGGGEAKHFISEGYVAVNGELETRKRRKMYDGDFFEFNQEYYVVVCDQPPIETIKNTDEKQTKKASGSKSASKESKKAKSAKRDAKKNATSNQDLMSKKDPAKNPGSNLSASAKKKDKSSKKSKPKAAETPSVEKSKSKDPNSGRGGIDFF
ncbi:RNA-binding S4 domain-containing protein [Vibrio sp. ZSDZ65]|uniref:RNA-binding S4 domain-containing protein n=1 Tax=Vibrio qingdaonensis TaxID=2829491 RepID=A0A9X3HVD8_9VIBR|nr:RNA-binding S4 domain-containing protein [Vibrio qingdaonensis]MCW8345455.1 RNA-binding S4 domain-containing protein [Vibrio qingdaonensis]